MSGIIETYSINEIYPIILDDMQTRLEKQMPPPVWHAINVPLPDSLGSAVFFVGGSSFHRTSCSTWDENLEGFRTDRDDRHSGGRNCKSCCIVSRTHCFSVIDSAVNEEKEHTNLSEGTRKQSFYLRGFLLRIGLFISRHFTRRSERREQRTLFHTDRADVISFKERRRRFDGVQIWKGKIHIVLTADSTEQQRTFTTLAGFLGKRKESSTFCASRHCFSPQRWVWRSCRLLWIPSCRNAQERNKATYQRRGRPTNSQLSWNLAS